MAVGVNKILGIAGVMSLLIGLSGCSGRPSEDDLVDALQAKDNNMLAYLGFQSGEINEDEAQCIAKVLRNSQISDAGLESIEDNDFEAPRIAGALGTAVDDPGLSKKDIRALSDAVPELVSCVG